jgi:hypothetical protein
MGRPPLSAGPVAHADQRGPDRIYDGITRKVSVLGGILREGVFGLHLLEVLAAWCPIANTAC